MKPKDVFDLEKLKAAHDEALDLLMKECQAPSNTRRADVARDIIRHALDVASFVESQPYSLAAAAATVES